MQFPETWLTRKKYGNVIAENEIGPRVPPVIKHSLMELGPTYPDYGPDEQLLYRMWRGPWTVGDGDLCPVMVIDVEVQRWDPEVRRYSAPRPLPNAKYSSRRPNARYSAPRLNARYSTPKLENFTKGDAIHEITPHNLFVSPQADDVPSESEDDFKDKENAVQTPQKTTSIVVRKRRR
jgi:hypothetical protein